MVDGIALILFIISVIAGAITFLYFYIMQRIFSRKEETNFKYNFLFSCSVVYSRYFSSNKYVILIRHFTIKGNK